MYDDYTRRTLRFAHLDWVSQALINSCSAGVWCFGSHSSITDGRMNLLRCMIGLSSPPFVRRKGGAYPIVASALSIASIVVLMRRTAGAAPVNSIHSLQS